MQLTPLLVAEIGGASSAAPRRNGLASTALLIPELAAFTQPSAQTQSIRDVRRADERDRRRRDDTDGSNAGAAPTPLQTMRNAERSMAPGSAAAAREQQLTAAKRDAAQESNSFRAALRNADAQQSRGAGGRDAENAGAAAGGGPSKASRSASGEKASESSVPAPDGGPTPTGSGGAAPADAPGSSISQAASAQAGQSAGLIAAASAAATAPSAQGVANGIASPATTATPPSSEISAVGAASGSAGARGGTDAGAAPTGQSGPPDAATHASSAQAAGADTAHRPDAVPRGDAGNASKSRGPAGDSHAAPTGNDDPNVEQIVRLVSSRIGKDRSVATIRLDPPWLGSIRLHIDLRQSDMALRIEPDTPLAHRLLSENAESLKRALEAAGIQLTRLEFRPPPDAPDVGGAPFGQTMPDAGGQNSSQGSDDSSAGGGAAAGTEAPIAMATNDAASVALSDDAIEIDADAGGRARLPRVAARVNLLV